ncbi:hypothetical protein G7A66_05975 [Altererythrobacter sp. SALINAS58]|uniref:hypothetical protein n=1 Tax=Alteripontixanthobacter muriae TaxID=2705546 RepID=UPI0015754ABD|nr:hypothetical protein [Alteripontixanthobacter muriae]NTZ42639.1 hypothetical protein [Alteripontixanthobacter muriae]
MKAAALQHWTSCRTLLIQVRHWYKAASSNPMAGRSRCHTQIEEAGMRTTSVILFATALIGCDAGGPDRRNSGLLQESSGRSETEPAEPAQAEAVFTEKFEQFELAGQSYFVPASQVPAIRKGGEQSFVRLKHPDSSIVLVFDGKSNGLTDAAGAPRMFSINDGEYPNLQYQSGPEGTIVCRPASSAQTGCGMKVSHGSAEWTVLFPLSQLEEAPALTEQALEILDHYADRQQPSAGRAPSP